MFHGVPHGLSRDLSHNLPHGLHSICLVGYDIYAWWIMAWVFGYSPWDYAMGYVMG